MKESKALTRIFKTSDVRISPGGGRVTVGGSVVGCGVSAGDSVVGGGVSVGGSVVGEGVSVGVSVSGRGSGQLTKQLLEIWHGRTKLQT